MSRVEGWDGNVVWLKVAEARVKERYERDASPDPHQYHFSNAPVADENYVRKRTTIIPKIPPKYEEDRPFVTAPKRQEELLVFRCDLCGGTFRAEDDRSSHVSRH